MLNISFPCQKEKGSVETINMHSRNDKQKAELDDGNITMHAAITLANHHFMATDGDAAQSTADKYCNKLDHAKLHRTQQILGFFYKFLSEIVSNLVLFLYLHLYKSIKIFIYQVLFLIWFYIFSFTTLYEGGFWYINKIIFKGNFLHLSNRTSIWIVFYLCLISDHNSK